MEHASSNESCSTVTHRPLLVYEIRMAEQNQFKVSLKSNKVTIQHNHILAFKVSWLRLKERQAIRCFFCAIRKLEGKFFCTPQKIWKFKTKHLRSM